MDANFVDWILGQILGGALSWGMIVLVPGLPIFICRSYYQTYLDPEKVPIKMGVIALSMPFAVGLVLVILETAHCFGHHKVVSQAFDLASCIWIVVGLLLGFLVQIYTLVKVAMFFSDRLELSKNQSSAKKRLGKIGGIAILIGTTISPYCASIVMPALNSRGS